MSNTLAMYASVGLDEDSSMRFRVCDDGDVVEFVAGGDEPEFAISFEISTLRRFVSLVVGALTDADVLRAQATGDTPCLEELPLPAGSR